MSTDKIIENNAIYGLLTVVVIGSLIFGGYQIFYIYPDILGSDNTTYSSLVNYQVALVGALLFCWVTLTLYRDHLTKIRKSSQEYAQYETILKEASDGVIKINKDRTITYWNNGIESLLGWSEEEVRGQNIDSFFQSHEPGIFEGIPLKEEVTIESKAVNYETVTLTRNDQPVILNITELRDPDLSNAEKALVIRNVTENYYRDEKRSYQERVAVVNKISAGIAHEVGNPLGAISSVVQNMARKEVDQEMKEKLVLIRNNVDQIQEIVSDLRENSEKLDLSQSNVINLAETIESTVGLLRHDERANGTEFEVSVSSNLGNVEGATGKFAQVMFNIVLNAMDAVHDTKRPQILVEAEQNGENAIITITDNGHGMDEETQEKLFLPFFTTKSDHGGTGLGLTVCKKIITDLGGSIEVTSKQGEGSTFTIELPTV